jgi:uncharacterized surface protein with fasciclin (FAS1) repeats
MKNLLNSKMMLVLFLGIATLASCDNDDDPTPKELNIVETAQTVPDLSILVDAVIQAGLVDALSASGDKTVLAPTNAAFTAFLSAKGFSSLSEVPKDVLTQILLNHVIAGTNYTSSMLAGATGYENTLADGPSSTKLSIYFDGTSGVTFNGGATVVIPDVVSTNGIVHVVDEVIDIPTIGTFATSNPALSTLVAVLDYADSGTPTVPYIETVLDATAGPFTVFAPTNDAFRSLLADDLMVNSLTEVDKATVDAVLLYHIVNANVQSSQLVSGPVATLGGSITADATTYTLTSDTRTSNIITTLVDIQGINGVVHVIDKVILPAP